MNEKEKKDKTEIGETKKKKREVNYRQFTKINRHVLTELLPNCSFMFDFPSLKNLSVGFILFFFFRNPANRFTLISILSSVGNGKLK